jgi:hypothetical protein
MKINKRARYVSNAALGLAGLLLTSVLAAGPPADLDIDGNGAADALTDGLLVIRYLFGFNGNSLTDGAVDSGCTRCTAEEITALLQCGGLIFGRYQPIGEDNGIIRDVATGLEWQRCSRGQTWNPATCRCDGEPTLWNWYDARYLTAPGGFRTPTIDELRTLVHCSTDDPIWINMRNDYVSCGGPYLRPVIVDAAFPDTPDSWFWSTSPYASNSYYAWNVGFDYGYVDYSGKDFQGSVRLVRAGP